MYVLLRFVVSSILIGFYLLANQRFITENWTPYIFVTVVSAVWGGYWPAILVETTQLCRCLLCFFKKRAAVRNELTVTLRRTCSFPCASFVKNFMSITSKERSFYFQAIYLTYIKFTNVVISWIMNWTFNFIVGFFIEFWK